MRCIRKSAATIGMLAMKPFESSSSRASVCAKSLDDSRPVGEPFVGSSELNPSLSGASLPKKPVSSIPTNPTFSNAGRRGVGMERSSIRKSSSVDIRDLPHYCDASLQTCEKNSTQQAGQHL